ncbi:MAG: ankyrin repeat domain-containing protein [Tatlockia sp.]|nr:ankyrin repeat domain-containing protein [Tatlockia sp.]
MHPFLFLFCPAQRIKLDIPIFLNGVQLYQQDSLYPYLYENGESPRIDRVLSNYPLASSKYFENKEGICKLRQFSSIYIAEELTHYFSSFAKISKSTTTLSPLVFVLQNNDHAITIGYDPCKGEWSFTNASCLPSGYTCDPEELAKEVHKAFSDNDVAIFSTEIFAEKQVEKEWEETVSTWEKDEKLIEIRKVTPEKTQRTDSKNQALLSLAAAQGDLELVEQVIEAEKIIPKEQRLRHVRCPALCMAVQNKNYNVVKRLLENGEDTNQTRQDDNVSPLLIAASQGDTSTISLLLENGSNPNAGTKDDFTSLHFSVLKDDLKMAKLILEKGGSCNNTAYNGITPLFLAAQNNKTEMVSLLLENEANIDLPMYSNSKLLLRFAKNNNIYAQMEELINKKLNRSETQLPLNVLISLSNKQISKPYISITTREIATILGHNEILALLDNNLKQIFIS